MVLNTSTSILHIYYPTLWVLSLVSLPQLEGLTLDCRFSETSISYNLIHPVTPEVEIQIPTGTFEMERLPSPSKLENAQSKLSKLLPNKGIRLKIATPAKDTLSFDQTFDLKTSRFMRLKSKVFGNHEWAEIQKGKVFARFIELSWSEETRTALILDIARAMLIELSSSKASWRYLDSWEVVFKHDLEIVLDSGKQWQILGKGVWNYI